MKHLEYFIFALMILLICIFIGVELHFMQAHDRLSNLHLDHFIDKTLIPRLQSTTSLDEVYEFLHDDRLNLLECTCCNWRQVIFLSSITTILTVVIVRIFYPMPIRIFILHMISMISILTLFMSLINSHYYERKMNFYKTVLHHIRTVS